MCGWWVDGDKDVVWQCVCVCLSASKIADMCVCLVFAQIVRAKSCVNICVKNFSKRGLKTFSMLLGYSATEMAVRQVGGGRGMPGGTGSRRGRGRGRVRRRVHLVVVGFGYLVASHICYLLQIYFEKFISIFIYFLHPGTSTHTHSCGWALRGGGVCVWVYVLVIFGITQFRPTAVAVLDVISCRICIG